MSTNNWRAHYHDGQWWGEIRAPDGGFVWPDCAESCVYCLRCLGCIRKLLFREDFEGYFHCPVSPDGDHHLTRNVGDN